MADEEVWDIDRERAYMAPQRISQVTQYILDHFDQKTYRGDKTYVFNTLTNISDVASSARGKVEEVKQAQRLSGFNSIFAVASVPMARLYYNEFKRQMAADPTKKLRIATIFSYAANEAVESDGILGEENSEDTNGLDQSSRDFLDEAIRDYNAMFHTNYSTDADKFQNYYKDVSLRMKNKELDLLIVVNMFLTGFDATTLNTLWVDKNLKMHGLIQAFSRTNRILNSVKTFGNIVCFRDLQQATEDAIALFGDKEANSIVLLKDYDSYYSGYTDDKGKDVPGYQDLVDELTEKFPIGEPIIGEQNEKDYIKLYGKILRLKNILSTFDRFAGNELLPERVFQDYQSVYIDLYQKYRPKIDGDKENINDDIEFEIELIRQVEINIDYILMLVGKYHASNCKDKEILGAIDRAIDSSIQLRSKKDLIQGFIETVNASTVVDRNWRIYVEKQKEQDLDQIIAEEKLKPDEAKHFIDNSFRDGTLKTTGTDFDRIMPPVSRFGGGSRTEKKQGIIRRLSGFFEKYLGVA